MKEPSILSILLLHMVLPIAVFVALATYAPWPAFLLALVVILGEVFILRWWKDDASSGRDE